MTAVPGGREGAQYGCMINDDTLLAGTHRSAATVSLTQATSENTLHLFSAPSHASIRYASYHLYTCSQCGKTPDKGKLSRHRICRTCLPCPIDKVDMVCEDCGLRRGNDVKGGMKWGLGRCNKCHHKLKYQSKKVPSGAAVFNHPPLDGNTGPSALEHLHGQLAIPAGSYDHHAPYSSQQAGGHYGQAVAEGQHVPTWYPPPLGPPPGYSDCPPDSPAPPHLHDPPLAHADLNRRHVHTLSHQECYQAMTRLNGTLRDGQPAAPGYHSALGRMPYLPPPGPPPGYLHQAFGRHVPPLNHETHDPGSSQYLETQPAYSQYQQMHAPGGAPSSSARPHQTHRQETPMLVMQSLTHGAPYSTLPNARQTAVGPRLGGPGGPARSGARNKKPTTSTKRE